MTTPIPPARTAKEQFDRQAAHYNAQWNTWTEATLHWLLDHADCQTDDEVLDVATGTGFTALAFAPHARSVVGLDVSSGMLAQARQKQTAQGIANVTWTEGAAESMPFADETFTLVTCRVAPHHFLSLPGFLSEVARVLKPGGRFLLADTSVPDEDPIADEWQNRVESLRDPSHVRNRSPREWRALMEQAELHVQEIIGPIGDIAITLNDWMVKAGCTPAQEAAVREAFAAAPAAAVCAFQIQALPNGDRAFVWQRVTARAVKG
jgi:ubiquinone/menaquinone biosynthesis C-methylase UbiE